MKGVIVIWKEEDLITTETAVEATSVVEITSTEDLERCIRQYARDARRNVKYRSNQLKEETFFVRTVLRIESNSKILLGKSFKGFYLELLSEV